MPLRFSSSSICKKRFVFGRFPVEAGCAKPRIEPPFVDTRSTSNIDISNLLKKRSNGTAVAGQAHIKTGLLDNVRSMAGYVLDKPGRRVVVGFFVNHSRAASAQSPLDALLHGIYARP